MTRIVAPVKIVSWPTTHMEDWLLQPPFMRHWNLNKRPAKYRCCRSLADRPRKGQYKPHRS